MVHYLTLQNQEINSDFTQLSHSFVYEHDMEEKYPSIKLVHLSKYTVTFLDPTLSDMHDSNLGIIDSIILSTVAESWNSLKCYDVYTTTFYH